MTAEPRSRAQRRLDTEDRLTHDTDIWVATASADGAPWLVPLSFDWDGETVLLATTWDSRTVRNLATSRVVRLGLGPTRDLTMIDGEVDLLPMDQLPAERADRFVDKAGFDPRDSRAPYCWVRVSPTRIQAWREEDELADRELMRGGRWSVGQPTDPSEQGKTG